MGVRAMGSGMISFGLVTIPVKLYSASQSSESISFNLLHGKCEFSGVIWRVIMKVLTGLISTRKKAGKVQE